MNSQNMVIMILIVSFSAVGSTLIIQSASAQPRPDFCQLVPKACEIVPYCQSHPLMCDKIENIPGVIIVGPEPCTDCPPPFDFKMNESLILTRINETGINETGFAVKLPTEDVLRMLGNISSMK
jgi:hypothetical protein